jgi:ribosome-associated translation inhibitor RaiA
MESLQIHFLDTSGSEAIEARVRERVEHLSRFCADIVNCDVWVATPHRHHRKGELYGIRIRLTVPGDEIDIDMQPEEADVNVAIREAFDAARRKLEVYERRRHGEVKAHPRAQGDPTRRRQIPARDERD